MTDHDQKAINEAKRAALADLRVKSLEALKPYLVPGVILTVEQCGGSIREYYFQRIDKNQQIIARPTKDTAALEEIADEDLDLFLDDVYPLNVSHVNRCPLDALDFYNRTYPAPVAADSWNVFQDHAAWSEKTFGQDRGPIGSLKHLKKEAQEAMDAPDDISEFADCQLLVWDAARRAGFTHDQLIAAAADKLAILKTREYPKVPDGEPSFHIHPGATGELASPLNQLSEDLDTPLEHKTGQDPITKAVQAIRTQLDKNLGYFTGHHRATMEILQSHIHDSVDSIEKTIGNQNGS